VGVVMPEILVVKRSDLFGEKDERAFQGFMPLGKVDFAKIVQKKMAWLSRDVAETNEDYKQIGTYAIIFNSTTGKFFVYRRSVKSGESRLQAKLSIGVGGHVEREDGTASPVREAMLRELREEVIVSMKDARLIGFINDDSDAVGRVHFGFCYLVESTDDADVNEDALEGGDMLTSEQLDKTNNLESWSQIAFTHVRKMVR
jgi:predicted NUDIX family phosphoesterase